MSFFIRNKGKGSSKQQKRPKEVSRKPDKKLKKSKDEEIFSDSDIESDLDDSRNEIVQTGSSSEEDETAQEKRLRLAKQYLALLEEEEAKKLSDDEEVSRDVISQKLKQQFLEQSGKLQKDIAQHYQPSTADDICVLRGHQLSVTCLVVSPDDKYIYSASKDSSLIKWDVANRRKVKCIPGGKKGTEDTHIGHTAQVLAMAISTDNKFLVSGDKNKYIYVWNPETFERLHILKGHRDTVSGLAFRKGSHQLFSASHDRTVKVWNLDEMAYIETLFGHQDLITGIDSLTRERAITSGGRDGSLRIWKIIEESQLVFLGHSGSIDCVALINEEHFISGADDNSLALWSILKKKPLCIVQNAHPSAEAQAEVTQENWITCVASLQNTDMFASGSRDGCVRLWKCAADFKSFSLLFSVPVIGFVNGLKFTCDGLHLVAAVGQEHRLGRWWRLKEAKNSVQIIALHRQLNENTNTARSPKKKNTKTLSKYNK